MRVLEDGRKAARELAVPTSDVRVGGVGVRPRDVLLGRLTPGALRLALGVTVRVLIGLQEARIDVSYARVALVGIRYVWIKPGNVSIALAVIAQARVNPRCVATEQVRADEVGVGH